jgi:hypothetical protein
VAWLRQAPGPVGGRAGVTGLIGLDVFHLADLA